MALAPLWVHFHHGNQGADHGTRPRRMAGNSGGKPYSGARLLMLPVAVQGCRAEPRLLSVLALTIFDGQLSAPHGPLDGSRRNAEHLRRLALGFQFHAEDHSTPATGATRQLSVVSALLGPTWR